MVIPTYNEELAIAGMIEAVRAHLDGDGRPWEILVVDNASTDQTAARVEPLLESDRIRLLRNDVNRGKGYSVRRGLLDARGELRLLCDADCEPSLESLPRMVAVAQDADVVLGSRVAPGARVERQQPIRRRIVGFGFLWLSRLLMRERTGDLYCGFKLWRAEAAEAVFARTQLEGWTFDVEAIAMSRALGYRVRECGITWVNRPDSRLKIGRVIVPVVLELIRARRHVRAEAVRARAQSLDEAWAVRAPKSYIGASPAPGETADLSEQR